MLFTHHVHSGQFCTHATSTLEEVIQTAIARGLTSIALTEHIPRDPADYYSGEAEHPLLSNGRTLWDVFDAYYTEACRLRTVYASQIEILVGFEGEWIHPVRSAEILREVLAKYEWDLWIGSVHHVGGIPIDFDDAEYARARAAAPESVGNVERDGSRVVHAEAGTDEALADVYMQAMLDLIREFHPPIIGHFDLLRLKSGREGIMRGGRDAWRYREIMDLVWSYGGVVEINTAALRKGLPEPYPEKANLEGFMGRVTLSDDSHGVDQLCTHYKEALDWLEGTKHHELWYFTRSEPNLNAHTNQHTKAGLKSCSLKEVRQRFEASMRATREKKG